MVTPAVTAAIKTSTLISGAVRSVSGPTLEEIEFDEGCGRKSFDVAENPMENRCAWPGRDLRLRTYGQRQLASGRTLCCGHIWFGCMWCELQVFVPFGLQWLRGEFHFPDSAPQP